MYAFFLEQCKTYFSQSTIQTSLSNIPTYENKKDNAPKKIGQQDTPLLFKAYPKLKKSISYIRLGNFATPIEHMPNLSKQTDRKLYIKRDDLCGKSINDKNSLFGGNKVRKLEFLLADAMRNDCDAVMTFGCVGSNHCVATAAYAQDLGLRCFCMLKPQANSSIVQRNLLLHQLYKSKLHFTQTNALRELGAFYTCLRYAQKHEQYPYIIPTGGSCPLGVLGFVNAAFELHKQIQEGLMPEPDYIYVPVGSAGTITGLLIGAKLLNLKSQIIGIAVEPEEQLGDFKHTIKMLFDQTRAFIKSHNADMPNIKLDINELNINISYCGSSYGVPTNLANKAITRTLESEHIKLDPTYSSKAFAGILDQCPHHNPDDVILFWHTFDGNEFENELKWIDRTIKPQALQQYIYE